MHNQFKPGDWSQLKQKAQAAADEFGSYDPAEAEIEFMSAIKPDVILALIAENERLRANVKMNLCDYPAIHHGDVELLISVIEGATQSELARLHKCTSQNICRKIRRVKERLGWKKGMGAQEVLERADQLRALAKQGAVVASDIIDERDQLRAEVEQLKSHRTDWQAKCLKRGFEYVREPDNHYVLADTPEMAVLLGELLGVEVRSKDNDSYGETVSELREQLESANASFHRAYELEKENEALRKDAERYRFVRQLAWYVDQAAYVYEIGNSRSLWTSERAPVDADDIEMAIDAAMGKGGRADG